MSFKERNTTVTLAIYTLILAYFGLRIFLMTRGGGLEPTPVFRLWGTIIILAIAGNILGAIIAQIVYSIIYHVRFDEEPEFTEDERDDLIDLKGTRITYTVSSFGVLGAMLTLVLDRPPLVMFTLLIVSGLVAQIVGDISRLYLYRRGV